jgi:hypothetical protein
MTRINLPIIMLATALSACSPEKCPVPWKVADKTVLPSAFETLAKNHDVNATSIPNSSLVSKVVIIMMCEPLGIYRVETETNP